MTIARACDKYEHMRGSLLPSAPRTLQVGDAQAGALTTEGVMTTGYASDAVDEEVQANIVAAECGR